MPVMDGIEETREIRQLISDHNAVNFYGQVPQPTIVGVTGHFDKDFIALARSAGMDQVESKPMYMPKLKEIL